MTFSIVARCPRNGMLGIGTSSKALAAGAIVPFIKAGVGAVASQSFANPYLGIDGLTLLEQGLPAERALERLVESDAGRELRQVGIVDGSGRPAAYTGGRCIEWAGSARGAGYLCLGNILAGEEVVQAMGRAFEYSAGEELPERLMQALEAGQEAGGDRRGRQSAGILVMHEEEYPWCDVRVDDHMDPVRETRRVLEVWKTEERAFMRFMPTRSNFTPAWAEVQRLREQEEREIEQPVAAKES
jgi:uncharacterized Ntn-hydrolase superfamily protein